MSEQNVTLADETEKARSDLERLLGIKLGGLTTKADLARLEAKMTGGEDLANLQTLMATNEDLVRVESGIRQVLEDSIMPELDKLCEGQRNRVMPSKGWTGADGPFSAVKTVRATS